MSKIKIKGPTIPKTIVLYDPTTEPDWNSHENQDQTFLQIRHDYVELAGTEGHPDSEFVGSLSDQICDNAVDTYY